MNLHKLSKLKLLNISLTILESLKTLNGSNFIKSLADQADDEDFF